MSCNPPRSALGPHLLDLAGQDAHQREDEHSQQMQDDLTTISTDSRLVVADGSGHDIHLERPELVTDAIRDVVARATD